MKRFPSGAVPWTLVLHNPAIPSAMARSGSTGLSAASTMPARKWPNRWRAAVGAGCRQLSTLPSGARTVTARKLPSLFGTSGASATLRPNVVYASV